MESAVSINKKDFKKSILGYDKEEVDNYIEEIRLEYENMNRENRELKSKLKQFMEQASKYDQLEDSLKESIKIGQSISEEVIKSANKRSENIIAEAEVQRDRIINDAIEESNRVKREYEEILRSSLVFKTRYRSFMESQLSVLEDFYEDIDIKKIEEE